MPKILAKQTNRDGSSTLVFKNPDERKSVVFLVGISPWVHKIIPVLKDNLVQTLAIVKERGLEYAL